MLHTLFLTESSTGQSDLEASHPHERQPFPHDSSIHQCGAPHTAAPVLCIFKIFQHHGLWPQSTSRWTLIFSI